MNFRPAAKLLIIFGAGFSVFFISNPQDVFGLNAQDYVATWFEIFKFSLTVLLVGGATLFYSEIKNDAAVEDRKNAEKKIESDRSIERLRVSREALADVTRSLLSVYNEVKFIKRELKKEFFDTNRTDEGEIPLEVYDKMMSELEKHQLEFETFKRLEYSMLGFSVENANETQQLFRVIESYLRRILKEYERREIVSSDVVVVAEDTLLFGFIRPQREDDSAEVELFVPFRDIIASIRAASMSLEGAD